MAGMKIALIPCLNFVHRSCQNRHGRLAVRFLRLSQLIQQQMFLQINMRHRGLIEQMCVIGPNPLSYGIQGDYQCGLDIIVGLQAEICSEVKEVEKVIPRVNNFCSLQDI